jgi:hypothetical protein
MFHVLLLFQMRHLNQRTVMGVTIFHNKFRRTCYRFFRIRFFPAASVPQQILHRHTAYLTLNTWIKSALASS